MTCEAYKVPAALLLSKIDLQDAEAVAAFRAVYEAVGYRVLAATAPHGAGLAPVQQVVAGPPPPLPRPPARGRSTPRPATAPARTWGP